MEKNPKNPDGPGFCGSHGSAEELQLYIGQKLDIIGQLAGGISHNFNNQLTGIMGFANLICLRADNENIKKFAEEIIGICKNAGDMVRELLTFARYRPVTASAQNVHNAIVTIANLLGNSIDKRIVIKTDFAAEQHTVFADAVQLQSSLLNLALNSKDAMPTGGTLTFSTRHVPAGAEGAEAAPYGYVRIEVLDTGTGISDNVKPRLFEPFFTTKAQGHAGLGLAAVHGLVKSMNGSIKVESEEGKGASVVMLLPAHAAVQGDECQGQAAKREAGAAKKKTGGTILLVDDDKGIRDSISAFLRSDGYSVFTADDGLDAVEKYGNTGGASIDLVILDMVMPRLGGKDAFVKMKEVNPAIKAIGITGFTNHRVEELMGLGMKRILHKPFAFEELSSVIAEYI
ncbi:MAG: response regulator [Chitinispirillales bacterium]|jgi:CheY-like chemotaxis protein|nr:response regulator [Chitinispirillales bacterium]